MRLTLFVITVLFALGTMAWAAGETAPAGYQAKLAATITIDQTIFAQLGAAAEGDKSAPSAITLAGTMIWAGQRGRVEIQPEGDTTQVMLYDGVAGVLYYLSPDEKVAYKTALPKESALSGTMNNPAQAMLDWKDFLASMKATPGVTVKDLGAGKAQDYDCHGFQFTIDMTKAAPPQPGEAPSALSGLGTVSGTAWVADTYDVAVSLEVGMPGMKTKWDLSEIKPWAIDEAILSVPKGYTVKEQDATLGE